MSLFRFNRRFHRPQTRAGKSSSDHRRPHQSAAWILRWVGLWVLLLGAAGGGGGARAQAPLQNYLIKLRDRPVVAHLRAQGRVLRGRMSLETSEAVSYRMQLLARQGSVRQRIEALPARVRTQTDTVFNGIAVSLRPEDVEAVRQYPEVEEVIPSIRYRKLLDAALPLMKVPEAWASPKVGGELNAGAGIKIAVIDTGIDIAHPMFEDPSLVAPPGYPRFTAATLQCPVSDQRFTNSKVIVARNYVSLLGNPDPNCDAADRDGHGTFVAAIAAGRRATAPFASIAGVAPKAFLGAYKVFGTPGTNDEATLEAIVKAVDDATKDGMDVINISLGATTTAPPSSDPLSAAVAAAVSAGVTVVVAAGNEGPGTGTVASPGISPAAITVGATTNSRILALPLLVSAAVAVPQAIQTIGAVPGNGPEIRSPIGPAPFADTATVDGSGLACASLPAGSLSGKLAVIRRGSCTFAIKVRNAFLAGALVAVIYNHQFNQPPVQMDVQDSRDIPAVMIGNAEGLALTQFLAGAGSGAQGRLEAARTAIPNPPNRAATFSSGGPSTDFGIKPDLAATGTTVYSAAQRNDPSGVQFDPSGFTLASGTSFSSPIVAGAAAIVKQTAPGFTPGQIKSALVNTAARVVLTPAGSDAGVLAQGNGLLDLEAALATPATLSPVSISFGARPPGSVLVSATELAVTNVSAGPETFSVTVTRTGGSEQLAVTASPASFVLSAGATQTVAVNAISTTPLSGNVEGFLTLRSQNTQRVLTVPYWGTFLRPEVNANGAVNAASFGAGSFGVAAGSLISVFGTDLANTIEAAAVVPLPTSLGGARVTMAGREVPFLFASPTQLNLQAPVELQGRSSADLVVHLNGMASPRITVFLSPAAPGIFATNRQGTGPGAILHASNGTLVSSSNPARPGEFLEVFATGLGATTPTVASGAAASSTPLSSTNVIPTATLGGVFAPVSFSGLAPSFVGLYQVNIQVPSGLPEGDQPLVLTTSGGTSNAVLVSVGR